SKYLDACGGLDVVRGKELRVRLIRVVFDVRVGRDDDEISILVKRLDQLADPLIEVLCWFATRQRSVVCDEIAGVVDNDQSPFHASPPPIHFLRKETLVDIKVP